MDPHRPHIARQQYDLLPRHTDSTKEHAVRTVGLNLLTALPAGSQLHPDQVRADKAAMVRVHRRLGEEGLKARLILTVHDELLIETPEEEAVQVVGLLRESMEGVIKLKVPLQSDIKTGNSWYETK